MLELNKIYLGDCLNVMKDIPNNYCAAVVTDLPYNEVNRDTNGLRNIDKGCADVADFNINDVLEEMWRVCKGSFYLFCGFGQISDIHNFFRSKGLGTRLIIWEKTNPSPMNGETTWLSGIEPCVFAKKKGATFNYHCKNTVIKMPIAKPTGHPTPKPITLMGELILASTNENEIILDPFIGGGTTGIAAIRTNRKFIGIEKEEKYFDIANKRITAETSQLSLF